MVIVSETYRTILGESLDSGRPCVIVRLTGCHRRCAWCDSAHAFEGGEALDVATLCGRVAALACPTVLVTGGEPLLQADTPELLSRLRRAGYRVVLETSGTRGTAGLAAVPAGVRRVVDLKAPGSGLSADVIDWAGIARLGAGDELKVVCADRVDYEWARDLVRAGRLPPAPSLALSPAVPILAPRLLAAWILEDGLDVRLQLQLHKMIWPERDRGI